MKNTWKQILCKYSGLFAALALAITALTENAACSWITYQEPMPEDAKKLRKF